MSVERGPLRAVDLYERIRQLEAALESRSVIARAQGIVMERYGISEHAAFALMRRISSAEEVKVRDVAAHICETRRIPRIDPDPPTDPPTDPHDIAAGA